MCECKASEKQWTPCAPSLKIWAPLGPGVLQSPNNWSGLNRTGACLLHQDLLDCTSTLIGQSLSSTPNVGMWPMG